MKTLQTYSFARSWAPLAIMTLFAVLMFAMPGMADAQITTVQQGGTTFFNILATIQSIIRIAVPILISAGVLFFIYGVVRYITASDDDGKTQGRKNMIQSVIGLAVIFLFWGLIAILAATFDVGVTNPNDLINPF